MIRPEPRKRCKCHNALMIWKKDNRRKCRGYWKCAIARREWDRKDRLKKGMKPKKQLKTYYTSGKLYCECHDTEAFWKTNNKSSTGGNWVCRVVKLEREKISNQRPERFLRSYITHREIALRNARAETIEKLKDIQQQRKELELVIRQK